MFASTFKKKFLPLSRRMYWTAWQFTGNAQDAEDLVQEAFMRLWAKRELIEDIKNEEAYCATLIKNLYLNQVRRKQLPMADEPSDTLMIAIDSDHKIEDNLVRKEESLQVKRLIDHLPEQQRKIITLHDMEDMSNEEIQEQTGLQPTNIRVLLSRARKTIREKLIKGSI